MLRHPRHDRELSINAPFFASCPKDRVKGDRRKRRARPPALRRHCSTAEGKIEPQALISRVYLDVETMTSERGRLGRIS
jgi:hypothetical protein